MIVFCQESDMDKEIHLMIGPESELGYDLYGNMSIDINEYLKMFSKKNKPIKIVVTRVNSEIEAHHRITQHTVQEEMQKKIQNGELPFPFNMIMGKGDIGGEDWKKSEKNKKPDLKNDVNISNKELEKGIFIKELICPKCGNYGVFMKKGQETKCLDCIKIDDGLKDNKKNKI